MIPEDIYKERVIKLITFSIGKRSFTVAAALNASGMGLSEFLANVKSIYINGSDLDNDVNINEIKDWYLKPEALFSYFSLKEFEHSVKSSKEAKIIAIISIVISGVLALGSIIVSFSIGQS